MSLFLGNAEVCREGRKRTAHSSGSGSVKLYPELFTSTGAWIRIVQGFLLPPPMMALGVGKAQSLGAWTGAAASCVVPDELLQLSATQFPHQLCEVATCIGPGHVIPNGKGSSPWTFSKFLHVLMLSWLSARSTKGQLEGQLIILCLCDDLWTMWQDSEKPIGSTPLSPCRELLCYKWGWSHHQEKWNLRSSWENVKTLIAV